MGEFASNGKANAGLTTGIIGTTLGGLWALGAGNGNGGILNGLLGGGGCNNQLSALMAENAMLKSENYSDKTSKEVYAQTLADNNALSQQVFNFVNPIAQTVAANQVEMARMDERIKCLTNTVNGITKVVVPNTSVCPGWGNVTITPATTTTT